MSKREGIVISIDGKYANLLTSCGEFIKVDCNGKKPDIGEKFMGDEVKHKYLLFNTRKILAVACIVFMLIAGGGAIKAYYSPTATVLVNINPNIELKVNFLNRIISFKALNNDGRKILNQIKINNININDGLQKIIAQSKKDKFIDANYVKTKTISIDISGKNINISKFKSNIKSSGLSIKIQSNGNIILEKNLSKKLKSPNEDSNSSSKLPTDNNFRKKSDNYSNHGNFKSNKSVPRYTDKFKSVPKQIQHSASNRIRKNQNSIKNVHNIKNKVNRHKNNLNQNNIHRSNSNAKKNKVKYNVNRR